MHKWREQVAVDQVHDTTSDKSHYIVRVQDEAGKLIGLVEAHPNKNDSSKERAGSVPLEGSRWAEPNRSWKLTGEWPTITLEPSLLCTACGEHGWIKNGRWESA